MADVEKDIVLRVKSETDQAQGQFKSLKQELRSIEQQLNQMAEAGDTGSLAFQQLQQRAGEVKDQIGDTKNAIKALSSDTFKLDAFAQAAQGIAGAFAVAQGAAALFSDENEELQKAILKVQSAMAILQGITEITNILQKDSALSLLFLSKNMKKVGETAEETAQSVKGVGNVLTGGLITGGIALLGVLIANWDELFNSVDENEQKMVDYEITSTSSIQKIINESQKMIQMFETFSRILGQGKTRKFYEDENKLLEYANKQLANKIFANQQYAYENAEFYESEIKILEKKKDLSDYETELLSEYQFKLDKIRVVEQARAELNKNQIKILENNAAIQQIITQELKKQDELKPKKRDTTPLPLLSTIDELSAKWSEFYKKFTKEYEDVRSKNVFESATKSLKDSLDEQLIMLNSYQQNYSKSFDQLRVSLSLALANQVIDYKTYNESIAKLDQLRIQGQNQLVKEIGNIMGALSETFGKETRAGKYLASAQALINTYLGISEVLRAKNPYPEPFGTAIKVASATAIGINGFNTVRNINKVQIPGGGGGLQPPAPPNFAMAPSQEASTTTTLGSTQLQLDASGNLIQGQTIKTYVLETDISAKQQRSKRLQQTATLGK